MSIRIQFIIFFILGGRASYAQPALIANDRLQVLYANYNNKVTISKNGFDCGDLQLSAIRRFKDSTEISGENCHYTIRTNTLSGALSLVVHGIKNTDIINDTITFQVKCIPNPTVSLGGKFYGGGIKQSTLLDIFGTYGIMATTVTDMDIRTAIDSFRFHLRNKRHTNPVDICSEGPWLSSEIFRGLQHVSTGDSVIFDHFIAIRLSDTIRDIGKMVFIITDNDRTNYYNQWDRNKALNEKVLKLGLSSEAAKTNKSLPSEKTLKSAKKRLIGRWEIINASSQMAICGIPIDYCGILPVCDNTRSITFRKNTFITDDTSAIRTYKIELIRSDSGISYGLISDKDTFVYAPGPRKSCYLIWANGSPEGSLYFMKLYYTLYRKRRTTYISPKRGLKYNQDMHN